MVISDVLFDLDDTLCDFSGAKQRGLDAAFRLLPSRQRVHAAARWSQREPQLYKEFATGLISRDDYRFRRFAMLAADSVGKGAASESVGSAVDAEAGVDTALVDRMNAVFMLEVNDRVELAPGAIECLTELRAMSIRCHLLTNGPSDGQRRKIDRLGLRPLLSYIQIGEEAGVFKPDPRAFELALKNIDRPVEHVLMVGDSLRDDVEAAEAVGMRAVHIVATDLADLPLSVNRL